MANRINRQITLRLSLAALLIPTIVVADVWSDIRDAVKAPAKATKEILEGGAEALGKLVTEGPEAAGEKLENGVDEAGEVIEEDITKQVKETSNRVYDQTIVDSGIEHACLLYTSPSPRDKRQSRMPSSA